MPDPAKAERSGKSVRADAGERRQAQTRLIFLQESQADVEARPKKERAERKERCIKTPLAQKENETRDHPNEERTRKGPGRKQNLKKKPGG